MLFKDNKQREEYWKVLKKSYTDAQLNKALKSLKPDTEKVIRLRFELNYSLSDICKELNRSITVVRDHHNRGIHLLYKYFNPPQAG